MKFSNIIFLSLVVFFFSACDPSQDDKITLPAAPSTAEFTITDGDDPNNYVFQNTTSGAFQYAWDFGNGTTATGESAVAFYPEKGTFEVTLTVFTAGGSASSTKVLEVPEDAPFQCEGNPLYEFLSDCETKVWKLNPAEGALWVGPVDGSTTWWASPLEEVANRPCLFDDTWTFTGEGEMIYDTNGEVWGEDYMGFNFECVDESLLQGGAIEAWGSGTHSYTLVNGAPNQLIVSGLGAFIGIPKAANGAEVTIPQSGITYDILRMENDGTQDVLEIEVNYSAGIWRFTLVSQ